jgi:GLPGLI family protein
MKKILFILIIMSFIKTYCQSQGGEVNYIFLAKGSPISTKLTFTNSIGLYKTNLNKTENLVDVKKNNSETEKNENNVSLKLNIYNNIPNDLGMLIDLKKNIIIDHKYLPLNIKGTILDTIFVKDSARIIKWEIQNEFKKINIYNCQMAKGKFRGRDYIVWFTFDIPISLGPWKLNGLPGLILEASDSKNMFHFYADNITLFVNEKDVDISGFLYKNYITPKIEWERLLNSMSKISEEISEKIKSSLPRGVNTIKNKKSKTILDIDEQLETNYNDIKEK